LHRKFYQTAGADKRFLTTLWFEVPGNKASHGTYTGAAEHGQQQSVRDKNTPRIQQIFPNKYG